MPKATALCPFCGSYDLHHCSNGIDNEFVECATCGASGPVASNKKSAIAAWDSRETQAKSGWVLVPKRITSPMIESAIEQHYGKARVAKVGGAGGVSMTSNGIDYCGVDAMRRFWKGALAAVSQSTTKGK